MYVKCRKILISNRIVDFREISHFLRNLMSRKRISKKEIQVYHYNLAELSFENKHLIGLKRSCI
jgi:hypothetical protein